MPITACPQSLQETPALANLLQRMLEIDPAARITADELLAHPWAAKDLPPGLASLNYRLAAAGSSSGLALQGLSAAAAAGGGEISNLSQPDMRQTPGELAALAAAAALPNPCPVADAAFGSSAPPPPPPHAVFSVVPAYGPDMRLVA